MNLFEKSILATVAYYDVLKYPLTGFEVFKYLISPSHIIAQFQDSQEKLELEISNHYSLLDVLRALENNPLTLFIEEKNGFYSLRKEITGKKGKSYINKLIEIRIKRQKISDQKWKKARKIIRWLQIIPCLKMVAVSGSLALDNAKEKSDIDLLIVAKHKRIWTVRFLITFFVQIIGKRRHGKKTADRICLNHYITDQSLKIKFHSLYNAQTYAHLIPVLEMEENLFKSFQEANQWIFNYLMFYFEQDKNNQYFIKENKFLRTVAKIQEIILNTFIGNISEKVFSIFQKIIIKKHSLKEKEQGRVITDNLQLEFHPSSPEAEILDRYNNNIVKLGLKLKPEQNSGLI